MERRIHRLSRGNAFASSARLSKLVELEQPRRLEVQARQADALDDLLADPVSPSVLKR